VKLKGYNKRHVAQMRETRNAYRIIVGKALGKWSVGRRKRR
jgi:hypothetical protein